MITPDMISESYTVMALMVFLFTTLWSFCGVVFGCVYEFTVEWPVDDRPDYHISTWMVFGPFVIVRDLCARTWRLQ